MNQKIVIPFSILITALFALTQIAFAKTGFAGAWCTPYLGAPQELGSPAYSFVDYGFPLPAMEVIRENCLAARGLTYTWLPVGLGVDSLLLALLAYPLWRRLLKINAMKKETA